MPGTFTYSPAAGQVLDATPAQALSVAFQPSSPNYTAATRSCPSRVRYTWSGFFPPTNNLQVLNRAGGSRRFRQTLRDGTSRQAIFRFVR